MPEFRKMMKGEEVTSPFKTQQEKRSTQIVYEDAVSLMRKVYTDLAVDKPLPPLSETVKGLIEILKNSPRESIKIAHTPSTGEYITWHAVNVSIISIYVGMRLGLDDSELEDLGVASLLHCIGRPIGIEKEMVFDALHLKTKIGYVNSVEEKLSKAEINGVVKKTLIAHHKAMGPNIYPFEPIEELNTLGKILCVVDTYCTLLHHPILRRGYYSHTALGWIIEHNGKPFESEILKALVDTIGFYPPGSWVELSTGEFAEIIETNPGSPMRPFVKVMFGPDGKPMEEPKEIDLSKEIAIQIKEVIEESKIPKPCP